MLEIRDICKEYKTGDLVQKALDHVSLNLRDNEFVAILGPSGSGKTTLLNIIGGLDRYDSGDLVINGISTKKYKDRDWDSYRNHTIGFVFQSYNLIPHQTVLANVELALTISGISGKERRERAIKALQDVGLGDQIHKKPNQMSGGQMQRVALARALVNDPDILLADEPTGALDTATSIQVMDLLKEVARDRLVVMVTHNPELAHQYATRIVNLKDGVIRSDSDPYEPETESEEVHHENMGKSSMSRLTALSLSLNNLMTKKGRTLLVSFAGSIGIIGIALILSISTGVNAYIQNTEEETLSQYPLEIQNTSFSLSSMMEQNAEDAKNTKDTDEVKERDVVSNMFSRMTSNDLKSLKAYIDSGKSDMEQYTNSIEYKYDVDPLIYREDGDSVYQVNPDSLLSSSGLIPSSSVYSSMFSADIFSELPSDEDLYKDSYDVKAGRWPRKYNEVVVVLGSDGTITDMTLYTLGLKDYSELQSMVESLEKNENTSSDVSPSSDKKWAYKDLLGASFKLVNNSSLYKYDPDMQIWTDQSQDSDYVKSLVEDGEDIKVVGVVQPEDDQETGMLTEGIDYPSSLTQHVADQNRNSEVVKAQLQDPDTNIFTGAAFGQENTDMNMQDLFQVDENKLASAFQFDTSKLKFDANTLSASINPQDITQMIDPSALAGSITINQNTLQTLLQSAIKRPDSQTIQNQITQLLTGYQTYMNADSQKDQLAEIQSQSEALSFSNYLKSDPEAQKMIADVLNESLKDGLTGKEINQVMQKVMDAYANTDAGKAEDPFAGLSDYLTSDEARKTAVDEMQKILSEKDFSLTEEQTKVLIEKLASGYSDWLKSQATSSLENLIQTSLSAYMAQPEAQSLVSAMVSETIDQYALQAQVNALLSSYSNALAGNMQKVSAQIMTEITNAISKSMQTTLASLPSAMKIDPQAFTSAISLKMDTNQMENFFSSLMNTQSSSYEDNMKKLGYADEDSPEEIVIYPKNFEAKNSVKDILDDYNKQMKAAGEDEKVISYTDVVGALMSSVTEIVNTVSVVLIAFVGISLVVSSIMIGVITYISVLERQKEIGILRAIGASKKNISQVFNAETFITGLLAGVMGIIITLILLIPTNIFIHNYTNRTNVTASLPVLDAVLLILLSTLLTMLGGLIPSRKAAKSDPVKALRTD